MSRTRIRRSVLAVAGITTGVTSLAVAPAVPSAAEAVEAQPSGTAQEAGTASHGTCFGVTEVSQSGGRRVVLPTTSNNSGNGHCIMSQGLGVGGFNGAVARLQLAIDVCYPGLRGILGPIDGQYGSRTRDAVIWVQAIEGASRDGVYGPETKNKMEWPMSRPPVSNAGCFHLG